MKSAKRALIVTAYAAVFLFACICAIPGLTAVKALLDDNGPSAKQQMQTAKMQHDHELAMIKIMIDDVGYEMGRGDVVTSMDRLFRLQEYVEKLPFKNGAN